MSADRANSARRLLQQDGVRANQVTQVRGYADQLLRVKTNPFDPSNRRVSILVKNDAAGKPPTIKMPVVPGTPVEAKLDPAAPGNSAQTSSKTLQAESGKAPQAAAPKSASNAPAGKPSLAARIRRMLPGAGK